MVRLAKDSPISKLFNRMHDGELRAYTMLVRNGVVAWIGDGGLLYKTTIDGTLVKNFEYTPYINKLSKERARNNALYKRLTPASSQAAKDGNDKLALAILDEVASEPKLSSPLFVTLCTNRCGRFLQRKEFDKALNQMKLIAEKYPKETQAQSWAYKMISNTAELNEIGGEYAGNIAMHLAKNYEGKLAFAWFKAAARSYEGAGKNQKALAALLAAEQKSSAMQKLKQYQKALTK